VVSAIRTGIPCSTNANLFATISTAVHIVPNNRMISNYNTCNNSAYCTHSTSHCHSGFLSLTNSSLLLYRGPRTYRFPNRCNPLRVRYSCGHKGRKLGKAICKHFEYIQDERQRGTLEVDLSHYYGRCNMASFERYVEKERMCRACTRKARGNVYDPEDMV
jgi:hypothetical protein